MPSLAEKWEALMETVKTTPVQKNFQSKLVEVKVPLQNHKDDWDEKGVKNVLEIATKLDTCNKSQHINTFVEFFNEMVQVPKCKDILFKLNVLPEQTTQQIVDMLLKMNDKDCIYEALHLIQTILSNRPQFGVYGNYVVRNEPDQGIVEVCAKLLDYTPIPTFQHLFALQILKQVYETSADAGKDNIRNKVSKLLFKQGIEQKGQYISCGTQNGCGLNVLLWDEAQKIYQEAQKASTRYTIKLIDVQGFDLISKDSNGKSDPYFEIGPVKYAKGEKQMDKLYKSSVQKKTLQPHWELKDTPTVNVDCPDNSLGAPAEIEIRVWDDDLIGKDFMGSLSFQPATLYAISQAMKLESITLAAKLEAELIHLKTNQASGYFLVKMQIAHKN